VTPIRCLIAIALTTSLAAAQSGDDFERAEAGVVNPDPTVTATLVPAPAGIGSGKALRVAWPAEHKSYAQFYYQELRPAPEITAEGGTVTVAVWIEAMAGVRGLSVRFTDANHETFQWSSPLPNPDQAGWRTVTFTIDPKQPGGSWGPEGKVDKVIDFPVRLNGFAFGFDNPKSPAGSILFDNVTLAPAGK